VSATAATGTIDETASPARSPSRLAWRRLRRDRAALVSTGFLAFLLLAVLPGAPLLGKIVGHGPNDFFPSAVDVSLKPTGPWSYVADSAMVPPPPGTGKTLLVLGADGPLGRDELQRLLYGGRVSLTVAVGATLLALLIGTTLGTLAAFFGGWIDSVISRFTELVMAFPVLLLAIMLGSTVAGKLNGVTLGGALNQGVVSLILLIGLFTWFYPARIVRSLIVSLRAREFVEAAEMVGSSNARIMRTHLFPHVIPALAVWATLAVATNIMLEAGITFLGVGIKLPTASWGSMLAATWGTVLAPLPYNPSSFSPWLTILPSAMIFLTVLALTLLGEGLREAFDPRGGR
jgi:ABC-type dipeptide/oligopeptide/nickel transport system permease subunit